jgi:hypothetical protein
MFFFTKQTLGLVGGWYPVFLNNLDTVKLNLILDKLKTGECASINYPKEQAKLAKNIQMFFQNNQFKIEKIVSTCHENGNLTCNHKDVVITVWSNYDDSNCKVKKL